MKNISIPATETIDIKKLKPDKSNPNKMTRPQADALKEAMQRYGFLMPIVTNRDLVVADGHHRLSAAKELGMQKVPVIRLDVKDVDRRLVRQVLNKLRGSHDIELDAEELAAIERSGHLPGLARLLAAEEEDLKAIIRCYRDEKPLEKSLDEDSVKTSSECPKCGYKW